METIDYKDRAEWLERYANERRAQMYRVACRLIILAERNPDREYATGLVRECIEELSGVSYKEYLKDGGQILDLYDNDDL